MARVVFTRCGREGHLAGGCPWPSKPEAPIAWTRADPHALASFDTASKLCTMNCGPSQDDPRTEAERRLLCGDCLPREVGD